MQDFLRFFSLESLSLGRSFHDQIQDKVNIIKGLEKTFYGATEFSIQDINGYILTFAEDE